MREETKWTIAGWLMIAASVLGWIFLLSAAARG